jgi:hypothetical protein
MDSTKQIVFLFMFIVILLIMIYMRSQINKKYVCPKLINEPTTTICAYDQGSDFTATPISMLYIKTAYNCCCRGDFKNDYVDIQKGTKDDFCALKNCALNGVRALDFTVYSLNDTPVISASTTPEINYKELYNYVDFNTTMQQVHRYFLSDSNSSLTRDPLFLIFRIQSDIQDLYESVATSLTQVFGVGNQYGNLIYNRDMDTNTTLNDIQNRRVVIIVQAYDMDKLANSSLHNITAYRLNADGYTRPYINRISDDVSNLRKQNIHFMYPNLHTKQSKNFDPTNSFSDNITFIGMNFQTNDLNLKKYNSMFENTSIILQPSEENQARNKLKRKKK